MTNLDKARRAEFIRAIKTYKGNVTSISLDLGIARSTFYRNIKKLNLEGYYADFNANKYAEQDHQLATIRESHRQNEADC